MTRVASENSWPERSWRTPGPHACSHPEMLELQPNEKHTQRPVNRHCRKNKRCQPKRLRTRLNQHPAALGTAMLFQSPSVNAIDLLKVQEIEHGELCAIALTFAGRCRNSQRCSPLRPQTILLYPPLFGPLPGPWTIQRATGFRGFQQNRKPSAPALLTPSP